MMDTLRLVLPPGVRGDRGICRLDVFGLLGLAMGLGTLADISWPDSGSELGSRILCPGPGAASLELE